MAHQIFTLGNMIAPLGWIALMIALFIKAPREWALLVARFAVPLLFALAYIPLLALNHSQGGGFDSIEHVRALFADDNALTAGWLHYLAFDLFVGAWISEDSIRRKILPVWVVPCLLLTFLFGPAGYLAYCVLRLTRKPSAEV